MASGRARSRGWKCSTTCAASPRDSQSLPVLVLSLSQRAAVLAQRRAAAAATWPKPGKIIDPQQRQPALDKMVLVGHSMGGLSRELQTIDSGNEFWNMVSEKPFELVKAPDEHAQELADTFFFQPNPSVRRVITIGTPFRGSQFANSDHALAGEQADHGCRK